MTAVLPTLARAADTPSPGVGLGIEPPALGPAMVERTGLLAFLENGPEANVVSIVAPAGYGKTTLMAQWAARARRPVAWLTIAASDNDPAQLFARLAVTLGRGGLLRAGSARPGFTSSTAAVTGAAHLAGELGADARGGILMLDQLDLIRRRTPHDLLAELVYQLDGRLRVVAASRTASRLPVAVFRAQGSVLELTPDELSMDETEAKTLLEAMGLSGRYDLAQVMERTEGWPAGVYLTGLALRSATPEAPMAVGGDDIYVSDYVRQQILGKLPAERVSFLVRTSILDQLCGPLCDAVLQTTGSARLLESLVGSNLLIQRLDRARRWHRYHHMFQDCLRQELELTEPESIPGLHRRAAAWLADERMPVEAMRHAQAAGDAGLVATLFLEAGRSLFAHGCADTLVGWMGWLEQRGTLRSRPEVAAVGALLMTLCGDAAGAQRWLAAAIPEGDPSAPDPLALLARALQARAGVEMAIADAVAARTALPPGSEFVPGALAVEGMARAWAGDVNGADSVLAESVTLSGGVSAHIAAAGALAERAVLAMARGDWAAAAELTDQGVRLVDRHGLHGYGTSALALVGAARVARHRGDIDDARGLLVRASAALPRLNAAIPGIAVSTYLELAKAYRELSDPAGAHTALRRAQDILHQRGELGVLGARLEELRSAVPSAAAGSRGPSTLTTAELRLLPLLATHLTFPEIGDRLFVSRHTVKTQAVSIYRKLGVSSRSEAVAHARASGLLAV